MGPDNQTEDLLGEVDRAGESLKELFKLTREIDDRELMRKLIKARQAIAEISIYLRGRLETL